MTATMRQTTVDTFDTYLAATSKTLTNKNIALNSNTITGSTAEFNSALSDDSFATLTTQKPLQKKLTTPVIASFNQHLILTTPTQSVAKIHLLK